MKKSKIQFRSYKFDDGCQLLPDSIHLWKADYETLESNVGYLSKLLNEEEIQRAARYKKPLIGKRFSAFRGILRILLGKYLSCNPKDIVFSYSSSGKPYLKDNDIYFNLSHTDDKAVFAFRKSVPVGVDIERTDHSKDCLKLAERFFSEQEYLLLKELPGGNINSTFAKCWARKEAFVKAIGKGLSYGLDSFSVSINDQDQRISSNDADVLKDVSGWKLPLFYPYKDTVCAVAVKGKPDLDCFELNLSCFPGIA